MESWYRVRQSIRSRRPSRRIVLHKTDEETHADETEDEQSQNEAVDVQEVHLEEVQKVNVPDEQSHDAAVVALFSRF